jgi:hypothetical protein
MRIKMPGHHFTFVCMGQLADFYAAAGDTQLALELREETVELRKAEQGPDHPATLRSMVKLAHSYYGVGRFTDAMKLCEEASRS